jgi:hypothetical protein
MDADAEMAAWSESGAMSLTGRADREPLGPPAGLVTHLSALGTELRQAAREVGGRLELEPLALLSERAAIAGLHRRGATSVGGATRLLLTTDGWMAVSLARPDDVAVLPAWLELDAPVDDPWEAIAAAAEGRAARELVDRARLVGLPAAVLGEASRSHRDASVWTPCDDEPTATGLGECTVVELGSLWAGPLSGALLREAGATVVKVESTARPDGARRGPAAFFDLLNAGKRSISLDLSTVEGVRALTDLVEQADVVIEASRPRALEQLGIDAMEVLNRGGPRVWISITGHGRNGPEREWVAFGDDAAVAGGLVVHDELGPVFCADAIADPITGVVASGAALHALAAGGRWLVDLALSAVAASLAGPTLPVTHPVEVAPPRARVAPSPGPVLGEHND